MTMTNIRVGYAAAAEYIGIPTGTLRSLVYRRRVPHIRLGPRLVRFDLAAVDRWLIEHAVEPLDRP
jgi:excisionase family DNA binding protein